MKGMAGALLGDGNLELGCRCCVVSGHREEVSLGENI